MDVEKSKRARKTCGCPLFFPRVLTSLTQTRNLQLPSSKHNFFACFVAPSAGSTLLVMINSSCMLFSSTCRPANGGSASGRKGKQAHLPQMRRASPLFIRMWPHTRFLPTHPRWILRCGWILRSTPTKTWTLQPSATWSWLIPQAKSLHGCRPTIWVHCMINWAWSPPSHRPREPFGHMRKNSRYSNKLSNFLELPNTLQPVKLELPNPSRLLHKTSIPIKLQTADNNLEASYIRLHNTRAIFQYLWGQTRCPVL